MSMKYKCADCGFEETTADNVTPLWCDSCLRCGKMIPIQSDSMVIGILLEGYPLEIVKKIASLKGVLPSRFLSDFLQESSMIMEHLEEELEDLTDEKH